MENSMEVPTKFKNRTYDAAISILSIYPKEMKTGSGREICTPHYTAVLFTIAKTWKQPTCPSTDEWIKKM